jgi:hypothetical protein
MNPGLKKSSKTRNTASNHMLGLVQEAKNQKTEHISLALKNQTRTANS